MLSDRSVEFSRPAGVPFRDGYALVDGWPHYARSASFLCAPTPLGQGLLSGKFHDDPSLIRSRPGPRRFSRGFRPRGLEGSRPVIEALRQIATDHGATPSQVALHWLVSFHGDAVVAIPGATKTRHVEDNVGAMALELTPAELARIDEVSRPFL